jgi:hypothetical protein
VGVIDRLRGNLLDVRECDAWVKFASLAGRPVPAGREKAAALEVAAIFDPVLSALEKLSADLLLRSQPTRVRGAR